MSILNQKTEFSTGPQSTYIKAIPLKEYNDLEKIKGELNTGNILIVKLTPLATRDIEAVKKVIDELKVFTDTIDGDIARLGEERIVLAPTNIRIWRKGKERTNKA